MQKITRRTKKRIENHVKYLKHICPSRIKHIKESNKLPANTNMEAQENKKCKIENNT